MHRAITGTPTDLAERLDRLAEELDATGVLTDPAWRDAFHAIPRHLFIPSRAWVQHDAEIIELDRDRDPQAWWDAVYSADTTIITQFNDGAGAPDRTTPGTASSSCPAPTVQFRLLNALHVSGGMKVLEIGTGTGWNAALLAHRLGDHNVVSVEIDPDLARHAVRALAASGHNPTVDHADGSHGYPLGAPYDRVIATCAVTQVPYAWIAQTSPSGVIVSPWTPQAGVDYGPLARLAVNPDGTASGRFAGIVGFMRLRGQRRTNGQPPPGIRNPAPTGTATSSTTTDPVEVLFRSRDAAFPARVSLGDGAYGFIDGGKTVWLSDPASASWARVRTRFPHGPSGPPEGAVEQYGPRRLWDEIEAVHHWWQRAGQPDRLRFGLTVTPDAQLIWLDDPTQPVFRLPTHQAPTFLATTR
jgi:protein-L-isoaspartate O-methyltransferase